MAEFRPPGRAGLGRGGIESTGTVIYRPAVGMETAGPSEWSPGKS